MQTENINSNCTIYIHIGHPKTGSSAIQAFLKLNEKVLLKNGYLYPEYDTFIQPFSTSSGNALWLHFMLAERDTVGIKSELNKLLQNGQNIILSCEILVSMIENEETMKYIFEVLSEYNIKIIIYLREQVEYFSSRSNQIIKNNDNIEKLIDYKIGRNYSKKLLEALKYTDKSNIIVRPYEKEQFINNNIFSDFLNCLNLEFTDEYILPEKIINPSLSAEATEYRRLSNITQHDKGNIQKKATLNKALAQYTLDNNQYNVFSHVSYYNLETQHKIKDYFKKDNQDVAETFLNRKNESLFCKNELLEFRDIDISFDQCIEISKYILNNSNIEYSEEDFKIAIIDMVLRRIYKINENNTTIDLDNFENKKAYSLTMKPEICSQHIDKVSCKKKQVIVESTGEDPWFLLPSLSLSSHALLIKIEIESSVDTTFQLFYQKDNEPFTGERVKNKNISKGNNSFSILIKSEIDISKIRIDPGNKKGKYVINSLDIFI